MLRRGTSAADHGEGKLFRIQRIAIPDALLAEGSEPAEFQGRRSIGLDSVGTWLSQRTSRRSFLARTFALTLTTVGVATVYRAVAPFEEYGADAHHNCGADCAWCGICGRRCNACGGTNGTCPNGAYLGSQAWSRCCCGYLRYYYDCCTKVSQCYAERCDNYCGQPEWCPAGYPTYYCSIHVTGSAC